MQSVAFQDALLITLLWALVYAGAIFVDPIYVQEI